MDVAKGLTWIVILIGALLGASLLSCWLALRPPRLTIPLAPADYGLRVEEITVTAPDGVRLAGWWAPRPGAPAVVLLHGYPAEKADMLPIAGVLHDEFGVLLMDLRYFGDSGGRVTTLGARERGDLSRTIDVLRGRAVQSVGVFGFSLGGAVGLMTAVEDPRIRAVAAYAPFTDLRSLGHELYAWLWLAKYPFVEAMILWSRLLLGVDLTGASPLAAARRLETPVLLIHSREDEQIPFRHAERLREALADHPRAEFVFMDRGRHGELPADFDQRLRRFFGEHLRP